MPARTPLQSLANLALLLDASDMEAPQAFASLQAWLEASQPALCADLAEAIDLFNFALARGLCAQLQAALAEASPV